MSIAFPFYLSKARDRVREGYQDLSYIVQGQFAFAPPLALGNMVLSDEGWRHARISIQASAGMYCCPRVTCEYHRYREFEVGFPDIDSTLFGAGDGTGVYGYVTQENIQEYINIHGGIIGYYNEDVVVPLEVTQEDITYYSLR